MRSYKKMMMLRKLLAKQDFNPDFLGVFINPFYFARKNLYKQISRLSKEFNGKILDVGCGTKPYRELFNVDVYHGLEYSDSKSGISHKSQDFVYDGHAFPFQNETYDGIISNEVLEHVFNPDEFLSEVSRVLKRNGKLLLTVPFVWDEHEQPGDFARYTSFGIKYLLKKHGFKIIYFHKSANNITIIFQLINDYIYKIFIGKNRKHNRIIINSLTSIFNILGLALSLILPKNNDLHLDNILLAQKKST
ncbi:MAG: class I SAM-dependent methyltransferase [Holosporaceae bacterium]|jgi:SAM-dependent methyltransferase|nr:class I SAM-dependent methyltransferase [Holosporaceae bacterium]